LNGGLAQVVGDVVSGFESQRSLAGSPEAGQLMHKALGPKQVLITMQPEFMAATELQSKGFQCRVNAAADRTLIAQAVLRRRVARAIPQQKVQGFKLLDRDHVADEDRAEWDSRAQRMESF
jgi:hypothetical protein